MHHVLITGAGKIGSLVACLFAESGDYDVYLADLQFEGHDITRLQQTLPSIKTVTLDITDKKAVAEFLSAHPQELVISCLPYFLNQHVAEMAKTHGLHYFDLTEDVATVETVKQCAKDAKTVFMPQCGLAPGFISIAAHSLMKDFDELDTVKLRVGALPENASNALQYALTWSTEGLINEYGNLCHGIENGKQVILHPLDSLESIQFDGLSYEAFNTSGGLGSLAETYAGQVQTLNYKTVRYPGHCERMRVLMNDLKLNSDRETLKRILEHAVPKTYQDVVLIYVSVNGMRHGMFFEENYVNKIYPKTIVDIHWSAIQITTAAGVCSVVDMALEKIDQYKGLVLQEAFSLSDLLANRCGQYFLQTKSDE